MRRREVLPLALLWPGLPALAAGEDGEAGFKALREGGAVLALRHALAPGVYDPPEFRLGDCSTQRNLNDEGRAQARRLGAAFRTRQLQPAAVRSSPWCRCVDTATLAFGRADPWAALGSPRAAEEGTNDASLQQLRQAIAAASARPGSFDVWVTHMFLLNALVGAGTSSGDGFVLRAAAGGPVRIVARFTAPA